MAEVQRGLW